MKPSLNNPSLMWISCLAMSMFLTTSGFAQPGSDIADSNLTDAERRERTLLWLDTFLTESGLLRQEDIEQIREAVARMSDTQLREWLEQTRELRLYAESDQWQRTSQWLREYLRVQAVYTEQELEKLRNDLVQAAPSEMLAILKRIQAKHDALAWMHQAAERNRDVEVAERDAYFAQQAAASEAARGRAAAPPLFGAGTAGGAGQAPSTGYRVPQPLITSRDVARATVWSEMWGPGFIIGF